MCVNQEHEKRKKNQSKFNLTKSGSSRVNIYSTVSGTLGQLWVESIPCAQPNSFFYIRKEHFIQTHKLQAN